MVLKLNSSEPYKEYLESADGVMEEFDNSVRLKLNDIRRINHQSKTFIKIIIEIYYTII